jgi:hypothetical protein
MLDFVAHGRLSQQKKALASKQQLRFSDEHSLGWSKVIFSRLESPLRIVVPHFSPISCEPLKLAADSGK